MARRMTRLLAAMVGLGTLAAWASEPVAVVTELQTRRGQVQVRAGGETDWSSAKPLQSLRANDQVRVTGEARAVLVFAGGRGTQIVTQTTSPFTVPAQPSAAVTDRARSVLGGVTSFLLGQQRERTYKSLSVRSIGTPPTILSPRDTRVLPGPVAFEWSGPQRLRYRVRLLGPQGVVWERRDLERTPLVYPSGAPALAPGARYTWELETPDHSPQRASFEVVPAAEVSRIREALAVLAPGQVSGYPPATLSLMRAGVLFQDRLYADARRELLAAIASAPEEPTLRLLLGHVYDRTGLKQLAGNEFDEAEALAAPRRE